VQGVEGAKRRVRQQPGQTIGGGVGADQRHLVQRRLDSASIDPDPDRHTVQLGGKHIARHEVVTPLATRYHAQRRGGEVSVVCTSGMPGLVTVDVLLRLSGCGAGLRYHGDFDCPGIAIANRLVADVGCRPWRMSAADYAAAVRARRAALAGPAGAALV
jgi:uncharacterized protein (TIGR02679 family)